MNIKQINEMYEQMKSDKEGTMILDPEFNQKLIGFMSELDSHCRETEKIVTSSISEKDFVRLMLMVQKMTVSAVVMNGSSSILQAEFDGSLQGYTHTVVMSVIGLLIAEEIL